MSAHHPARHQQRGRQLRCRADAAPKERMLVRGDGRGGGGGVLSTSRAGGGGALRPTPTGLSASRLPPSQHNTLSSTALFLQIFVPPHPLVKHWVAVLRSSQTPTPMFRSAAAELGRLLIYEAARDWLPTVEGQVGRRGWTGC